MSDLEIFKIPLGNITLEKMDIGNKKHTNAMRTMRDDDALQMCYDIHDDITAQKQQRFQGNSFLVSKDNQYVGYVHISDVYDGERILAYIVKKTVRGKGLGTVILTSVGDYLFEHCDTSVLKLYINKRNQAGIRLAEGCGFKKNNISDETYFGYDKKR